MFWFSFSADAFTNFKKSKKYVLACIVLLFSFSFPYSAMAVNYTLNVSLNGAISGAVYDTTGAINCGSTCSASVPAGTVITLRNASAAESMSWTPYPGACYAFLPVGGCGSVPLIVPPTYPDCATTVFQVYGICLPYSDPNFTGWSGDCTGTAPTCTITVDGDKNVTAGFNDTAGTKTLGSGCPGSCSVAEPISLNTGNLFEEVTDYQSINSNSANSLKFTRYYNSTSNTNNPLTFAKSLGVNWRSNYDRYLHVTFTGGVASSLWVERADGQALLMTLSGSTWVADTDVDIRLTQSGSTWTLVDHNDATEVYTVDSAGKGTLNSTTARDGYAQTLSYNTSHQLATVTDSYGRSLNLTYTTGGLIQTVSTPGGLVVTYGYDTGGTAGPDRLISVGFSTSPASSLTYTYATSPSAYLLSNLTDENGNNYSTWHYTGDGRASLNEMGNSGSGINNTQISYSDPNRTVTGPLLAQQAYTFTTLQKVLKLTQVSQQPIGTVVAATRNITYDSNGYVQSRTDWNGNTTTYVHDARGNETQRVEASGTAQARTITTTPETGMNLPHIIAEPNRTTTLTHDSQGNLLTKTIASSSATRSWNWTYYATGLVKTSVDPLGHTTQYFYNTAGNLTSVVDPLGHTTTFTSYDADGRLLVMTDPNGLVTTFTYDPRGRLTGRTLGTEYTSYTYDAAGNLVTVRAPDNKSVFYYTYDNAHRLYKINNHIGESVVFTLDAAGNVTKVQAYDASSNLRTLNTAAYDALSRLYQKLDSSSHTTTYTYDPQSNLKSVTDPLSHVTQYNYDALNRLSSAVNAASGTTAYNFDANDNLHTVTSPRGFITTYNYDGIDDMTSDSNTETYNTTRTYDAAGNVHTSTDQRGKTTTYTYDALNRMTKALYADGTSANYTYDTGTTYGIGHLTGMTDLAGTTYWFYDQHGRVTQKQQIMGVVNLTVTYGYDSYGRMASITYPSGKIVTVAGFDNAGRITSLSPGASAITYYPFGPAETWTQSNGTAFSRPLDRDGFVVSTNTGTNTQGLTWDSAKRLTALTETGLPNKSFTYDAMDRIATFVNNGATTTYQYDADSNRAKLIIGAGTTNYNMSGSSNRLSSLAGLVSQTNSYDAVSNLTSDGSHTFNYDARGRMASIVAGGVTTSYLINGLGQRIGKVGTGVATGGMMFVYDEAGHMLGEYDSAGNVIEETVWLPDTPYGALTTSMKGAADIMGGAATPNATPVAVMTGTGGSAATYAISPDWLNAPYRINDASGTNVWWWDHLPFGDQPPMGSFVYNLRFPGQYYDSETGAYDNGFRTYGPTVGRYFQPDPIGLAGGINRFNYVEGNPVTHIDPKGLCAEDLCIGEATGTWLLAGGGGVIIWQEISSHWHQIKEWCENRITNSNSSDTSPGKSRETHCQTLKQSILNTCASLTGRKKFACFQAAQDTYEQCMAE